MTAGASTPNWQIRRVTDHLKEIGMSRGDSPWKKIRRIADITVMTYGWAALAGGGLTAAGLVLQGRPVTWLPLAVTMLFGVFHAPLEQDSGEVRSGSLQHSGIADFYVRHRRFLTFSGFLRLWPRWC